MGSPDGGWFDETPPRIVSAVPEDKSTHVSKRRIYIHFDEYVTIENPTENVVVSPPQKEAPDIKAQGKRIKIELKDSLRPNTTYTIDFSNSISDNNEGNPLGNYTYSFSTGESIDTLQVSGYVLQADNLEPVQGILVGLYDDLSDSIFKKKPMLRISRTDSRGHFVVKGIAPGRYRIYALQDADGDYIYGQKSEKIAFSRDTIVPSFRPDVRQDTTWIDSLHIKTIDRVDYTHFLPDDICLLAFNEIITDRHLIKSERKEANCFTLYYSYGRDELPSIKGLNFNADDAFLIDASEHKDTITYWLRDSILINRDTLNIELKHHITDTLGVLRMQTDTLSLLSKQPYEKRMKRQQRAFEEWKKAEEKKKKKGEPYDSVMPPTPLELNISPNGDMNPDENVRIVAPTPIADVDKAQVHLYSKVDGDTIWYREPFELNRLTPRSYILRAEWKPKTEYSLEADSAAFRSIYGDAAKPVKTGLKVRAEDSYATLLFTLEGMTGKHVIGQLMDGSDKVVKEAYAADNRLEFFYLSPGKYYLRLVDDRNNNGRWDTGNYAEGLQPESVYYYPEEIECKAKWDVSRTWNPTSAVLYRQKPAPIVKQKADKEKKIRNRNYERAKQLGIEYIKSK